MLHHGMRRAVAIAGGGVIIPASWNPDDKASNVVLTNDNYTMKGLYTGVRAFDGKSSGEWYFEGSIDTTPTLFGEKLGMFLSTNPLTELGTSTGGICIMNSSTAAIIYYNNAIVFTNGTTKVAAGDVIMWRWKYSTGEIWVGLNGVWFNSGNPVYTNANLSAGIWHKGGSSRDLTTQPVSLSQSITYAVPSGSTSW